MPQSETLWKEKINEIKSYGKTFHIMEVCGTHTMAISRLGIRTLLKDNVRLISGPGCPVCVTPDQDLDYVYALALEKNVIIATYGDMLRVPGSNPQTTLEKAKAHGADVRIVYSSIDALQIAEDNQQKKVVFLGIGFETTAPATAVVVKKALEKDIGNFYVLSLHKRVEPVMRLLLDDSTLKIDGFLCPGHVGVIIGEKGFSFLEEYQAPGVITGFALDEILEGLAVLVKSIENHSYGVKNAYQRLVRPQGNTEALHLIEEVFEEEDSLWRGMGRIEKSGMKLKKDFGRFDILTVYPRRIEAQENESKCRCGDVLKGKIPPDACPLFATACSPEHPVGPCMVSSEGSCAAYYRYRV